VPGARELAPPFARVKRALEARPATLAERDEPYKEAAVALVLRESAVADDVELLLIRRAMREGDPWSGQIGLPGGRWSANDGTLERTALRETHEEVGLDVNVHGSVLGQLDELRPRTPVLPPIIVRPFVVALHSMPDLVPSGEVAEMRWVRVSELFHADARVRTSVHVRDMHLKVDAYQMGDFTVWGMTERILATFAEIWR
jgi:8-oxo-dGTP pyrophosphatase MutT (NUDIX family)